MKSSRPPSAKQLAKFESVKQTPEPPGTPDRQIRRKQRARQIDRQLAHAEAERKRKAEKLHTKPELTAAFASEFVKIINSGAPPYDALRYMAPGYFMRVKPNERRQWLREVSASQLTFDAQNEWNGGQWEELPGARRIQLAMDKFLAECAYVLYTKNYARAAGDDRAHMDSAANRLRDYLKDQTGEQDSPWKRFVEEFMKDKLTEREQVVGVSVGESVPMERLTRES